jgi:drug/metabolite transporter (DMT)-like permease
MMLSVGLYAIQDVIIKLLPSHISVVQIIFFRSLFAFIPIFFMMRIEKEIFTLKIKRPLAHILRTLLSTLALLCFIASFRLLPLPEAYSLTFSSPLFISILSPFLLGETLYRHRLLAVIIGFFGVVIMMQPGSSTFSLGGLIALGGGFFYALSIIMIRELSKENSNVFIVMTFVLMSLLLSSCFLPFYWIAIDLKTLGLFVIIGILGGSAKLVMTHAFRLAPVSAIAPFDYAALIWAMVLSFFIWGHIPDLYSVIGMGVIVMSGVYLITHEKRGIKFKFTTLSAKS